MKAKRPFWVRVKGFVRLWLRCSEEACLTHTPGSWCQPGAVYERDGKRWLVTELRREIDTGLIGGGRASCWSVLGKRIDDLPNAPTQIFERSENNVQSVVRINIWWLL